MSQLFFSTKFTKFYNRNHAKMSEVHHSQENTPWYQIHASVSCHQRRAIWLANALVVEV